MNWLINRCPESVDVNGVKYPIHSDFRTSISFELALSDPELTEEHKVLVALRLYYDYLPEDREGISEAFLSAFRFYNLGDDFASKDDKDNLNGEESIRDSRSVYSYRYDTEYIFTSFMVAYNIDLSTVENLHWWKFKVLFNNLPEDTIMKKIIDIRTTKVSSSMSKDEKKRIIRLKKIYELPVGVEVEDKEFNDSLSSMF